jgi:hypothetical protein
MQQQTTNDFRTIFLLKFTKELIENSASTDLLKLNKILEQKEKNIKENIKEEKKDLRKEITKKIYSPTFKSLPQNPIQRRPAPQPIRIPAPRLPQRFQYLKPTPINQKIDLGKLNPLANDPAVKVIECLGANENINVITNNKIKTKIILTEEEIKNIIQTFSKTAKIPTQEGNYRVVVGKFILSALINPEGSKFTIEKIRMNAPRRH